MIIYLIGCLITYILCKIIRYINNDNEWEDIKITWFAVLFSWLTIILFVMSSICYFITEIIPNYIKNKKPPKWL